MVCRTGYTGERGYELIVANEVAGALWDALLAAGEEHGILPCGLGARDTLRTEMGYPLHGQDITLDVTPNQARLGWAVGWKKPDVLGPRRAGRREGGRARSACCAASSPTGRGIPRPGMSVSLTPDVPLGEITSGTFSPTLRKGIGLALVPSFVNPEAEVGVDVRGRREIFRLDEAAVRRPVRARGVRPGEPARPAPDLPPAQPRPSGPGGGASRTPPAQEVRVEDDLAGQRFANQADAESWVGETWSELADAGVDAVTLFEHDRQVYGPMSLHA